MWFYRFRQAFIALLLPWLLAVLTQSAGRVYLLSTYGTSDILVDFSQDVSRMFWVGGLFDIRIASLLFVPCLLIAGMLATNTRGFRIWQRSWPWLAIVLSLIVTVFTVGNIFYYATYERFIDIFIFGLVEDDTAAVLTTVWQDYPVSRALFFLTLLAIISFKFYRHWQRVINTKPECEINLSTSIIGTLIVLLICFLGMRGSLGTFPLRQSDAQVSEIKFLNMFTPNGLIALNWAFNAHDKTVIFLRQRMKKVSNYWTVSWNNLRNPAYSRLW